MRSDQSDAVKRLISGLRRELERDVQHVTSLSAVADRSQELAELTAP